MFRTRRTLLTSLALFACGFLFAGHAQAAEQIELKVSVIHASKAVGKADPALKKIESSLRKAFGGFSSFQQVANQADKLTVGKKLDIKLPNGQNAVVEYKGKAKKHHQLRLTIPTSKVAVDLSVPSRKMFYQAGIKHKDGILVLAFYLKD
jgi:hypothetical protein